MSALVDKIVALHTALDDADIPHAFGGALALAWCTQRARGTIDIDVNVFVDRSRTAQLLAALPEGVRWSDDDRARIERDGQVRLWWGETPVDVFVNTTEFHEQVAERCHDEPFGGLEIPFLACVDLAVFKVVLRSHQGLGRPRGDGGRGHARHRSRRRHPLALPGLDRHPDRPSAQDRLTFWRRSPVTWAVQRRQKGRDGYSTSTAAPANWAL